MRKVLSIAFLGVVGALSCLAGPIVTSTATLDSLIDADGGSLTVGDKTFTNFSLTSSCSNCTPDSANFINISTLNDGGLLGLRISGPFAAMGPGAFGDWVISFDIQVNPAAGMGITNVGLLFNGAVVAPAPGSFADVVETVRDSGGNVLGQIAVTNPPAVLQTSLDLSQPFTTLHITKDIQLGVGGKASSDARSTISVIDQFYTQNPLQSDEPVPEPISLVLMGSGLALLRFLPRRKRSEV